MTPTVPGDGPSGPPLDENFGIDFNSQDRMLVRSPSGWRSEVDRP
jgi:hypothetical protein